MSGSGRGKIKNFAGIRVENLLVIDMGPLKIRGSRNYIQWNCTCDCGKSVLVTSKQLQRGQKSCGCHKLLTGRFRYLNSDGVKKDETTGKFLRLRSDEEINISKLINRYSYKARKNKNQNKVWGLTYDEAKTLFSGNCSYCGCSPQTSIQVYAGLTLFFYNGIDRIDSSKGYTVDNTASCCKICNTAKNNMSVEAFLSWVSRVAAFNNK